MSFTYDFTAAPDISKVRALVGDTTNSLPNTPIWQDEEINGIMQMFTSGGITIALSYVPAVSVPSVISHRRTAAALLRGLAANAGRMMLAGLLDARVTAQAAAASLNAIAKDLIASEENDGFFAVAEMAVNQFAARERLYDMVLRQGC
jgi:hypothetical protein